MLKKVAPEQLEDWKNSHPGYEIIDVREDYEFDDANIGGKNVPLDKVMDMKDEIARHSAVLFCCKSGKRSAAIVFTLQKKFGLNNIYSLEGGLEKIL